jgi:hypothetical protein
VSGFSRAARALGVASLAALASGACSSARVDAPADAGSPDAGGPEWKVVLEHLDGTLLSIWGTSPNDVYSVGGPRGNAGFETLVVHFDGSAWKRLAPGGTETYWWVSGSSPTDVWMVGEKGRITHYDGTSFVEHASGTGVTLFGAWAASPTDAWAVGGTPEDATAETGVLLHFDGTSWSPSPLPEKLGRTYFKVWGTSSENLYIVGEAGVVWHRVGATWSLESKPPLAHGTLLTVFGCSKSEVYAVGGRDLLFSDGTSWSRLDVTLLNDINGVSCGAPGEVVVVGGGGLKLRRVAGQWQSDFGTVPYADLHGSWVDSSGALWAAGGNFIGNPIPNVSREGVVARYARGDIPSTLTR